MVELPDIQTSGEVILPELGEKKVVVNDEAGNFIVEQAAGAASVIGSDVEQIKSEAKLNVSSGNEDATRQRISIEESERRQTEAVDGLRNVSSMEGVAASVILDQMAQVASAAQEKEDAMEEAYAESLRIKNSEFPTGFVTQLENPDVYENNIRDIHKASILFNKLSKINAKADEEGWGTHVGQFLKDAFGINIAAKSFGAGTVRFANRIEEINQDIAQLEPSEIDSYLDTIEDEIKSWQFLGENHLFVNEVMQLLGASEEERFYANNRAVGEAGFVALDFFGVAKALRGAYAMRGVVSTAEASAGNIENIAKKLVQEAHTNPTSPNVAKSAVEANTLKVGGDPSPSGSAYVAKHMAIQEEILDDVMNNLTAPQRLNETEMAELAQAVGKEFLSKFDGGVIGKTYIKDRNGITSFGVEVMRKNGDEFSTKLSAQSQASRMGIDGYEIIQSPNGGYKILANVPLDQANFPIKSPETNINLFRKYFDNIDNWVDPTIVSKARQAEGASLQLTDALKRVYRNSWGRLNRGQRTSTGRVLERQREANKWYSEGEFIQEYKALNNKMPTDKEILAFHTYRQLNDFDFSLTNRVMYEQAYNRGYKNVSVVGMNTEFNGRVVSSLANDSQVYDLATGRLQKMNSVPEGKVAIEVDQEHIGTMLNAGDLPAPVKYVILDERMAKVSPLKMHQLAYKAGGRRTYDHSNRFFIKQKQVGTYQGGGSYRMPDKTMFAASTRKQAQEYVERFNKGLALLRDETLPRATLTRSMERLGFGSLDEFEGLVQRKGIDPSVDIAWTRDRELIPSEMTDFSYVPEDRLTLPRRTFNQKRGDDVLEHVDGSAAKVFDPFAATVDSLDRHANLASFYQFKESAVSRFAATYRKYLDASANDSMVDLLYSSVKGDVKNESLRNAITGHQEYLKAILRHQTPTERKWQNTIETMVDWAQDSKAGTAAGKVLERFGKDRTRS